MDEVVSELRYCPPLALFKSDPKIVMKHYIAIAAQPTNTLLLAVNKYIKGVEEGRYRSDAKYIYKWDLDRPEEKKMEHWQETFQAHLKVFALTRFVFEVRSWKDVDDKWFTAPGSSYLWPWRTFAGHLVLDAPPGTTGMCGFCPQSDREFAHCASHIPRRKLSAEGLPISQDDIVRPTEMQAARVGRVLDIPDKCPEWYSFLNDEPHGRREKRMFPQVVHPRKTLRPNAKNPSRPSVQP